MSRPIEMRVCAAWGIGVRGGRRDCYAAHLPPLGRTLLDRADLYALVVGTPIIVHAGLASPPISGGTWSHRLAW
ncbi:MAG: hypothetical protein E6Q97_12490 [Desulfurellales bacterium]|nr:MAG: hypothetical protein E6Q97_12490 [Desulfurellales bacterium]